VNDIVSNCFVNFAVNDFESIRVSRDEGVYHSSRPLE